MCGKLLHNLRKGYANTLYHRGTNGLKLVMQHGHSYLYIKIFFSLSYYNHICTKFWSGTSIPFFPNINAKNSCYCVNKNKNKTAVFRFTC